MPTSPTTIPDNIFPYHWDLPLNSHSFPFLPCMMLYLQHSTVTALPASPHPPRRAARDPGRCLCWHRKGRMAPGTVLSSLDSFYFSSKVLPQAQKSASPMGRQCSQHQLHCLFRSAASPPLFLRASVPKYPQMALCVCKPHTITHNTYALPFKTER